MVTKEKLKELNQFPMLNDLDMVKELQDDIFALNVKIGHAKDKGIVVGISTEEQNTQKFKKFEKINATIVKELSSV